MSGNNDPQEVPPHALSSFSGSAAARAVGHVAGELAAGRGDVVAARLARGDGQPGALQHLGETPDRARARSA